MDLELSPSQQELVRAFSSCLAKESSLERVRQAEPLGFDPQLWCRLTAMGVPSLAVPEAAGGGGAGLLEAALVCEVAGRHLAPAPVVESLAAARALAAAGQLDEPVGEGVAAGQAVATLALGPDLPQLVPAGAVAEVVVGAQGPDLAVWRRQPPGRAAPNFASLPVAWLEPGPPLTRVPGAAELADAARDEWLVLAGAWLAGLARAALELGVSYAKARRQFGVPIGSFQAVAHRLADVATAVDGAGLLWQEAAWAADEGLAEAPALASAAFVFCAETAEQAAAESLHFHGGYGYTLEYDIQLYFRRARGMALLAGSPAAEYLRLADKLYGRRGQGP